MSRRGNHEGTFYTRPDGRICYQVTVDGRRIATYGRTKTEAKRKADEKVNTLGAVRSAATVTSLLEKWTEDGRAAYQARRPKYDGLAPTTFDQYRYLLHRNVVPLIGGKRVDALTKRLVVTAMTEIGGSTSKQRSTYAALVKLLEYARREGIVGTNVMRDVDRPRSSQAAARDVTRDEALRMLTAAVGHRWQVAVWLGLGAGLRRGEMLGLKWDDVDFDAGTAYIVGNVTRSSAGLRRGDPKTKRGRRIVPLTPDVAGALKSHRKAQLEEHLAAAMWVDSGHVLTNEIGGVGEPRKLSRVWSSWAHRAKVADRGTHVGRHFAASTALASGKASVADVAAMLGHDPSVLLSTYAVPAADGQRAAMAALSEALTRPSTAGE